ncbi:hypothetical protein [Streptomyces sp. B22F1]|uniref:hypothetical protein n=1 Tax=Streptomyces sp. B22F1 TaxID=3153566 RepID=UPI00325EE625
MAFFDDVRAEAGSGTAAPAPAERVRTILATAGSLTLETDGFRCDLVGLHTTAPGPGGRLLRLRPPAESALAARVVCAPAGDLPVRLHLTDIAPVGVRDRVRARVTLTGWLAPETGRSAGAQAGAEEADADRLVLGFDPAEALVAAGAGAGAGDPVPPDGRRGGLPHFPRRLRDAGRRLLPHLGGAPPPPCNSGDVT